MKSLLLLTLMLMILRPLNGTCQSTGLIPSYSLTDQKSTKHQQQLIIRSSLRRFEELKRKYATERTLTVSQADTISVLQQRLTDASQGKAWFQTAYSQELTDRQQAQALKSHWQKKARRRSKVLIGLSLLFSTYLYVH